MKADAELVRLPQLMTASTLTWREGDSFQSGDYRYLLDCSNDELDAQMRECERTLASTSTEYLCIQHLVNGSCLHTVVAPMAGFTIKIKLVGYVGSHIDFFFII